MIFSEYSCLHSEIRLIKQAMVPTLGVWWWCVRLCMLSCYGSCLLLGSFSFNKEENNSDNSEFFIVIVL